MVIERECRCRAYPWPHEFGGGDCGLLLARREREADEPERPMRIGMGFGSYGRPAIDDMLDDPRRYEK